MCTQVSVLFPERRSRILVGLAWTFATLFSMPMLYMSEQAVVDGKTQCWLDLPQWIWQVRMTGHDMT